MMVFGIYKYVLVYVSISQYIKIIPLLDMVVWCILVYTSVYKYMMVYKVYTGIYRNIPVYTGTSIQNDAFLYFCTGFQIMMVTVLLPVVTGPAAGSPVNHDARRAASPELKFRRIRRRAITRPMGPVPGPGPPLA
jgi:hypothetical protein